MSEVQLSGLGKKFAGRGVLDGVDLVAPDGALTAVLGPSGCGKTTLLRAIAGFERPDSGSVSIGGEIVADARTFLAPQRRRVGFVAQSAALFPHLDVSENVAFALRGRDLRPGRAARVEEVLDLVGLAGLGHRQVHELSGGQQQRVALGRALAPAPRVLLLDEPFSSLDARLRATLRAEVAELLRSTGTTALLVTHDQDEALSLADHVAVLRAGRITQSGGARELYEQPADEETAAFVGVANVLDGRARAGTVETALGRLVAAAPARPLDETGEVRVLVRPEQLRLGRADDALGGEEGVVTAVEYHGHDALVSLDLTGPALRLVARSFGAAPPARDSRVRVRVVGPVVTWPRSPVSGDASR